MVLISQAAFKELYFVSKPSYIGTPRYLLSKRSPCRILSSMAWSIRGATRTHWLVRGGPRGPFFPLNSQEPAEISEAHLRVGMDSESPIPLTSDLQAKGMAINKSHSSKLWGFLWGFLESEKTETHWYETGEPPGSFTSVVCLEESASSAWSRWLLLRLFSRP